MLAAEEPTNKLFKIKKDYVFAFSWSSYPIIGSCQFITSIKPVELTKFNYLDIFIDSYPTPAGNTSKKLYCITKNTFCWPSRFHFRDGFEEII